MRRKLCKLYVDPMFKKNFKTKASANGMTIAEYSRIIALKDDPRIGLKELKKSERDFFDFTI